MEICAVHAVGELGLEGKVQVWDAFRCFRGDAGMGQGLRRGKARALPQKKENGDGKSGDEKRKRMEKVGIRRGK